MHGHYSPKQTINYDDVKKFWDKRSSRAYKTGELYVANLNDRIPRLGWAKDHYEQRIISQLLGVSGRILDLGCGTGRLSLFFSPYATEVVAVDFVQSLLDIGIAESRKQGITNISFVCEGVQEYSAEDQTFDLIFLGGVLSYLNDNDFRKTIHSVNKMLKTKGVVLLRESLKSRCTNVVDRRYKKDLEDVYSIVYRSRVKFERTLKGEGFAYKKSYSLNVFPFVGASHMLVRLIFGSNRVYDLFSRWYFLIVEHLVWPWYSVLINTVMRPLLWLTNAYEQRIFVFYHKLDAKDNHTQ